jgi:hypothetical protein
VKLGLMVDEDGKIEESVTNRLMAVENQASRPSTTTKTRCCWVLEGHFFRSTCRVSERRTA